MLPRRGFARLLTGLFTGLPIARWSPTRRAAQGAVWTMATEYPANTVSGDGIAFFTERLAAGSGRRLTVLPSYDTAFGLKSADIPAAIHDGRLAAGCSLAGALGRLDPLFLLSSLPFVATRPDEARKLLDKALRPLHQAVRTRGPAAALCHAVAALRPVGQAADRAAERHGGAAPACLRRHRASRCSMPPRPMRSIFRSPTQALASPTARSRQCCRRVTAARAANCGSICHISPRSATPCRCLSPRSRRRSTTACRTTSSTPSIVPRRRRRPMAGNSLARRLGENYARMRANGVTITPIDAGDARAARHPRPGRHRRRRQMEARRGSRGGQAPVLRLLRLDVGLLDHHRAFFVHDLLTLDAIARRRVDASMPKVSRIFWMRGLLPASTMMSESFCTTSER